MIQPILLKKLNMKSLSTTAKKLTSASLVILMIPFLFFVSRLLQQLGTPILPDAWLEKFSQNWSSWLRNIVFAAIVVMLPFIAVILNLLSLIALQNDRKQTAIRSINYILVTVAGLTALLFTIVMLAD